MTKLGAAAWLAIAAFPATARAADTVVPSGGTLTLVSDLVLSGSDRLEVNGTAAQRCTIVGNGFRIVSSGTWTGHLRVSFSDVRGLGTSSAAGIQVTSSGTGYSQVEGSVFDACGAVNLTANGSSTITFRNNTILETALPPVVPAVGDSRPTFVGGGTSQAQKVYQGNRVYKSWCEFNGTGHWLVGGDTDAQSNIHIGIRAGYWFQGSSVQNVLRGNYLYSETPLLPSGAGWSQISGVLAGPGLLIEHNVLRHAHWVTRGVAGQCRYNLMLDPSGHNWIDGPGAGARIHHNLFIYYGPFARYAPEQGIHVRTSGNIQVYNNTFDGGGQALGLFRPCIDVSSAGFVDSLRNNAFTHFPNHWPTVHSGYDPVGPDYVRLGSADYNLFNNLPNTDVSPPRPPDNYGVIVAGKRERLDAGFALNDVPAGGAKDAQVDPRFQGPLVSSYPIDENQVKAGTMTVSQILARFRGMYRPGAGSPLIDAGDPADGAGTDIGAIGTESPPRPDDLFGRFGAGPVNQAPAVAITGPPDGTTVPAPGAFTFTATASDPDGTVSKVEFFNGSESIGSDTTAPYAVTWSGAPAGAHAITARATDNGGMVGVSALLTVTVTGAADADGDGMPDAFENAHGFDPADPDQDGNGIPDGQDDWDGDGTSNLTDASPGSPPAPAGGGGGGGGGCGLLGIEALILGGVLATRGRFVGYHSRRLSRGGFLPI